MKVPSNLVSLTLKTTPRSFYRSPCHGEFRVSRFLLVGSVRTIGAFYDSSMQKKSNSHFQITWVKVTPFGSLQFTRYVVSVIHNIQKADIRSATISSNLPTQQLIHRFSDTWGFLNFFTLNRTFFFAPSVCTNLPPLSIRMSNRSSICWLVAVGTWKDI